RPDPSLETSGKSRRRYIYKATALNAEVGRDTTAAERHVGDAVAWLAGRSIVQVTARTLFLPARALGDVGVWHSQVARKPRQSRCHENRDRGILNSSPRSLRAGNSGEAPWQRLRSHR